MLIIMPGQWQQIKCKVGNKVEHLDSGCNYVIQILDALLSNGSLGKITEDISY